jgi:capsid protein
VARKPKAPKRPPAKAAKRPAPVKRGAVRPRADVESARATKQNLKSWEGADGLNANSAYTAAVRQKLRNRSRYEALNDPVGCGVVKSRGNDLVGVVPRPQLTIPGMADDEALQEAANEVEQRFLEWADAQLFGRELRVSEYAKVRDGAVLGLLDSDERSSDPVQLAYVTAEIDLLETPPKLQGDPDVVDGIRVDRLGRERTFYLRDTHPGDTRTFRPATSYREIDAGQVCHWYAKDRPGQVHGIPETTPSLQLYAHGRRYILATILAMEVAASVSGIIKTTTRPNYEQTDVEDWEIYELARGALLTMPADFEPMPFPSNQPITGAREFMRLMHALMGRASNMPLNIATGDSRDFNFASGKLDLVPYTRFNWIERSELELIIVTRVARAWAQEAMLIPGHLPEVVQAVPSRRWAWNWDWDGFDDIDPFKAAKANDVRLRGLQTSLTEVLAADGVSFDGFIDLISKEIAKCRKRGIRHPLMMDPAAPDNAGDLRDATDTGDEHLTGEFPHRPSLNGNGRAHG